MQRRSINIDRNGEKTSSSRCALWIRHQLECSQMLFLRNTLATDMMSFAFAQWSAHFTVNNEKKKNKKTYEKNGKLRWIGSKMFEQRTCFIGLRSDIWIEKCRFNFNLSIPSVISRCIWIYLILTQTMPTNCDEQYENQQNSILMRHHSVSYLAHKWATSSKFMTSRNNMNQVKTWMCRLFDSLVHFVCNNKIIFGIRCNMPTKW